MTISVENFINSLPVIGKGYLGVFVVTALIIATVYLLNAVTSDKKGK